MTHAKLKVAIVVGLLSASLPVTVEWRMETRSARMTIQQISNNATTINSAPSLAWADPLHHPHESITAQMIRILALEHDAHREAELGALVRNLEANGIEEALHVLMQECPNEDGLREAFLEAWGTSDPESALIHAAETTDLDRQFLFISAAYKGWTLRDPAGAWAYLETADAAQRPKLANHFFRTVADQDRAKGLAIALDSPSDFLQMHHVAQLFQNWARTDAEAALAACGTIEDAVFRNQAYQTVIADLILTDPSRAMDQLTQLDDGEPRREALEKAIRRWNSADVASMANFIQNESDPEWRRQMIEAALPGTYSLEAIQAKLTLLEQCDDLELKKRHAADYLEFWAANDAPEAALTLSAELQEVVFPRIAKQFAHHDPQAGLRWGSTLDNSEQRTAFLADILSVWSKNDLGAAVQAVRTLDDPDILRQALPTLADAYAKDEPADAADWILQVGGEEASTAVRKVLTSWSRQSPEEAEDWFVSHANHLDRDEAIQGLVDGFRYAQTERAAHWAMQLSSEAERTEALQRLVPLWIGEDARSLQAWLSKQEISLQQDLLSRFPRLAAYLSNADF